MGLLDSLKRWLSGEATEVRDSIDEAADALNADLDRRESELTATPEEKMGSLLDEIEQSDQQLDELTDQIRARSEAYGEVVDADGETPMIEDEGTDAAI